MAEPADKIIRWQPVARKLMSISSLFRLKRAKLIASNMLDLSLSASSHGNISGSLSVVLVDFYGSKLIQESPLNIGSQSCFDTIRYLLPFLA